MVNQVTIVKVVSRSFLHDFVARIQNLFGKNLTSYEQMIQKGVKQIEQDLVKNPVELKWFRYELSQLNNGAMAILFYGELFK